MTRIFKIIVVSVFVLIQSCVFKNQNEKTPTEENLNIELFDKYSNDSIRNRIFEIAYNNKSSAPSYIVFNAKDLNTGVTKEICCEAPFLSGAMHRELNVEYDENGIKYIDSTILANREKTFHFINKNALANISFYKYPDKETIDKISKTYNLDDYFNKFGANDLIKYTHFENDTGFVQVSFALIMFKCGIITSRDCIAGNNIWFGDPNISMPKIPN
ncbi:hypothetical protein ACE01N_20275 [Saccharicrinis sp. FJH2]|uniref:hypothetical protein n=1 Tax=Saccharicrinis sp. FJH65 TaxID=3344659 RepID=UPI0035F3B38D